MPIYTNLHNIDHFYILYFIGSTKLSLIVRLLNLHGQYGHVQVTWVIMPFIPQLVIMY